MAGGVRVVQPANLGPELTPPIDTVEALDESGRLVQRQRVAIGDSQQGHVTRASNYALPSNATGQVATLLAPPGYGVYGFVATGTGDGYFVLTADGETLLEGRISQFHQQLILLLPRAVPLNTGSRVTLTVRNETPGTRDYVGTIVGEVTSRG